jgi:hypothetical protein
MFVILNEAHGKSDVAQPKQQCHTTENTSHQGAHENEVTAANDTLFV